MSPSFVSKRLQYCVCAENFTNSKNQTSSINGYDVKFLTSPIAAHPQLIMFILLIYACLAHASSAQRYNERNVLPADNLPSSNNDDYDSDYYGDGFRFEDEEETHVYKWNVEEYPHPKNNSRFCNRLKPSHVCDPDMVLTKEHADNLDSYIGKLYKETPCICDTCINKEGGIVVGIALLKHMYQPYNIHPVKVIRSFAETLRQMWRLGKCDNDILIVVATTDRLSYTDVGKTTSDYISIHEAHSIFVANRAKFTEGKFFEGLRDILEGYHAATRDMTLKQPKPNGLNISILTGGIVGAIFLLGLLLFIGIVVYRKCRKQPDEFMHDPEKKRNEGIASSWTKKDIKVLFGSEKMRTPPPLRTKYQPCQTEECEPQTPGDGEEVIDFRLASPDDTSFPNETQITNVTTPYGSLGRDLTTAAEGIMKTFPRATSKSSVLVTDI